MIAGREADAIEFVLELGKALHRFGTPADRLEQALGVICKRLGLDAEVFTTPTTIIMSFGDPSALRTRMMRVTGGELDMDKLDRLDDLADDVIGEKIPPAEGVDRLAEILAAKPRYRSPLVTAMNAVSCGGMAVFLGGNVFDVLLATAIGLVLGILELVTPRSTDQTRVFELVGSAIASFAASLASSTWGISPTRVTLASLLVLLPGLSLTLGMRELATRNLIAGTARLMSAVIVLLQLVIGVALGEKLAAKLVSLHVAAAAPLPASAQWLALVISALAIAIVVQSPPRAIPWILGASVAAYIGSDLGTRWLGADLGVAVGAFLLGVLGNVYARIFDRPSQIVLVPAVLVLVPGSVGYRGLTSLLSHDTLTGVSTVFSMFIVATGIVAGLLIANAVVSPRRSL